MRILFFGDTVGEAGSAALTHRLPALRALHAPDFVVVNGENLSPEGRAPSLAQLRKLSKLGIDCWTLGNHSTDGKDGAKLLTQTKLPVLRAANYPATFPGVGSAILACGNHKLGVISVMGRTFINDILDCPFAAADAAVATLHKAGVKQILVDIHAEATSEKNAMSRHLDGRVSAVVGTHTHVQTADEEILPAGTAYLTDVGMSGSRDSVIGADTQGVFDRFLHATSGRIAIASKPPYILSGVLVETDARGKATQITRIHEILDARGRLQN
jgi:hypothetical protein